MIIMLKQWDYGTENELMRSEIERINNKILEQGVELTELRSLNTNLALKF